eukprot:g70692.t1
MDRPRRVASLCNSGVCVGSRRPLPPRRPITHRCFSAPRMEVFNKKAKLAQRDRTALLPNAPDYQYLHNEVARRLVDRLQDISMAFPAAIDFGCSRGHIARHLRNLAASNPAPHSPKPMPGPPVDSTVADENYTGPDWVTPPRRVEIDQLLQLDCSEQMLQGAQKEHEQDTSAVSIVDEVHGCAMAAGKKELAEHKTEYQWRLMNEEDPRLPPASADLIVSSMFLHWTNDLPGIFQQIFQALKPNGCFLGAMLGGETLQELRSSFALADMERQGGVRPHVSPLARVRDVGDLLGAAGFKLNTLDTDEIVVRYPDMFTLMDHLQKMGENHAPLRPPYTSRDTFLAAASVYEAMYADEEHLLPLTFEIIWMIGWVPHESQQKPKARGSAKHSFHEINKFQPPTSKDT